MHELWLHRLITVVQDMYLLNRHVAFVHIIEQQFRLIHKHVAKGIRILAFEVALLFNDHASDRQQQRLVGGIAIDTYLLLKMAHRLGVVDGTHGEGLTGSNRYRGVRDGGAATRRLDITDKQWLVTTVFHFKFRLDGMLEYYLPTVDCI